MYDLLPLPTSSLSNIHTPYRTQASNSTLLLLLLLPGCYTIDSASYCFAAAAAAAAAAVTALCFYK